MYIYTYIYIYMYIYIDIMHRLLAQQEREQAAQEHENILDAARFVICTKK